MPDVHQVTITPSALELDGGPHSQPFGSLTAHVFDANHREVSGCPLTWVSSNPGFIIQKSADPYQVSVGSYQPGKSTITVREASSGKSASAVVTVHILDGGLPRQGSRSSLAGVITSVRTCSGREGRLAPGAMPTGNAPAPTVRGHSFNLQPGQSVHLEVSPAGQASHLVVGAVEMDGYYELDLRELDIQESDGRDDRTVSLALGTASDAAPGSFNLEIATRTGADFSERAAPVFVQIKGDV